MRPAGHGLDIAGLNFPDRTRSMKQQFGCFSVSHPSGRSFLLASLILFKIRSLPRNILAKNWKVIPRLEMYLHFAVNWFLPAALIVSSYFHQPTSGAKPNIDKTLLAKIYYGGPRLGTAWFTLLRLKIILFLSCFFWYAALTIALFGPMRPEMADFQSSNRLCKSRCYSSIIFFESVSQLTSLSNTDFKYC